MSSFSPTNRPCCDPLTYKDAFDIGMSAQQSNPCRFLRCERLHKQPVSLTLNDSLFGSGSVPNHFHRRRSGGEPAAAHL
eukprot:COSAG04_NODE_17450_length_469_cov_0.729730_1_plen_78_part_10